MKAFQVPLFTLCAAVLAADAGATTITYNDFSSTSGLQLNGSALQSGNVLRITPASGNQAGSVFSTNPVNLGTLASFSTRFQFRITSSGGIIDSGDGLAGADGLAFVIQPNSNTAGSLGGGIGYQGIANSVGVEFDTYNNGATDDNNGNHVGIDLNGNTDSVVQAAILPAFNNGNIWTAWVDYNGLTNLFEVRVNQTGLRPVAPTLTSTINLASVLGNQNAYIGFTAATGGAWGNHDIINWTFEDTLKPIGDVNVPDGGASLALLSMGMCGVGWMRRKLG